MYIIHTYIIILHSFNISISKYLSFRGKFYNIDSEKNPRCSNSRCPRLSRIEFKNSTKRFYKLLIKTDRTNE